MSQPLDKEEHKHWRSFLAGDRASFAWIYESYVRDLYNYGKRFAQDPELLEDTIQDLFVRLWNNKKGFKTPPSVKNYLFTSLRHMLFRRLSQRASSARELNEEGYLFYWEIPHDDTLVSDEIHDTRLAHLKNAMGTLTARQKEALYLKYYENASYEQISEIMKISVKATYKLMARAVQALKAQWANAYCAFLAWLLFHF